MSAVLRTEFVSRFVCLAEQCEDTCCKHWSMQLDNPTLEKYKKEAPDLLDSVEAEPDGSFIMRKNAQTGYCVRYDGGKCGIHATRGDTFLGDACHFYPRVTRTLGEQALMSATMSCPEIVRLAFYGAQPFALSQAEITRLPQQMKNILPDGMEAADALVIHESFIAATQDENASAEQVFLRIASVSRSIQRIQPKDWKNAVPLYLRLADGSVPAPEKELADPFNIVHALCGLIVATQKPVTPRLQQTLDDMQQVLHVTLDWQQALIHTSDDSAGAYETLRAQWKNIEPEMAPLLKRWLAAQLSTACYPFAGLGHSLVERVTIIGVRLATLRLALMCSYATNQSSLPQDVVVRVVQSLSRFLEHLGDPAFSLQIYAETGWDKEARMCGLLNK